MASHLPSRPEGWEGITASPEETVEKGRELATRLRAPVLVLLSGDLGSGKTTLAKGIISGLGAAREEDVTSPTFTLVHAFRTADAGPDSGNGRVYHVDLYRIEGFHDLETLGLEDVLADPAVVIVEWPERLTLRVDWPVVRVRLEPLDGGRRRITVAGAGAPAEGAVD